MTDPSSVGTVPSDPSRGWFVAVGAAFAVGASFGTLYTFGVFTRAMSEDLDAGRGATALVYGITLLLFYGFGIISGPLADRFGPRPLVLVGTVCMTLGLLATSRVESVAAGYVTYGVGVGLGGGLVITPVYAAVGGWITARRLLAMGIVGSGIGIGTLALAPLAGWVVQTHGWRSGYVVLAIIVAVTLGGSSLLIRRPPVMAAATAPAAPRAMLHLLGVRPFRYFIVSSFLSAVAVFAPFALVVDFAEGAGVSAGRAAMLTGLIGASSVVGRLGISLFARRFDQVRLLQGCLALQAVSFVVWLIADDSYALLVVFVIMLGGSFGGYVSLVPSAAIALFGSAGVGVTMGLVFLGAGLGGLVGPPLTGWIADLATSTTEPIVFVIVIAVSATLVALGIPLERSSRAAGDGMTDQDLPRPGRRTRLTPRPAEARHHD